MTFHSFTAFLMSKINPWLTENEGVYDMYMSGRQEGQSDTKFENISIWRNCSASYTRKHEYMLRRGPLGEVSSKN